jgi:hypothetical protein
MPERKKGEVADGAIFKLRYQEAWRVFPKVQRRENGRWCMQQMKKRRRLAHNPSKPNELFKMELPGAWEPSGSSGPFLAGKGKEAQVGFLNRN